MLVHSEIILIIRTFHHEQVREEQKGVILMTEKRFISKNESIINVATDELVNASCEESAKILIKEINELSKKKGVIIATHDTRLLKKGKNICLKEK